MSRLGYKLPSDVSFRLYAKLVTLYFIYKFRFHERNEIYSSFRRGKQKMAQKIYVGNLAYATSEETLTTSFSQYGEVVSAIVIRDRETQRSKGFGFVEMEEQNSAESAIEALDGSELDGRKIRVNVAEDRPRNSRPPRRDY